MRSTRRTLLLAAGACLLALPARADRLDDYIKAEMERRHIPGLTLAVVRNGKVIRSDGYGYADVENRTKATKETVYEIGSITKQFTATAIVRLIDTGKLRVDQPINEVLPGLPSGWDKVTVRHLLTHTSGIKSYTSVGSFEQIARNNHTPESVVKSVAVFPLEFQPGERYAYNNTGYYLLGMIVEKVSGQKYWDYLDDHFFRPLGMTHTRSSDPSALIPNRAKGYGLMGEKVVNRDPITASAGWAAGSVVSTVGDMAKWDAALYGDRILPQSRFDAMWQPTKLNGGAISPYGFGWAVGRPREHRNVSHGGGTAGFSTYFSRYPEDKLTVIVLTNLSGAAAAGIANKAAEHYLPDLRETAIDDPDRKLTDEFKDIVRAAGEGKPLLEKFTPEMQAVLKSPQAASAPAFIKSMGEIKKLELLERKADGPATRYRYRIIAKNGNMRLAITRNPDGKIAGMLLQPD